MIWMEKMSIELTSLQLRESKLELKFNLLNNHLKK